MYIFEFPSIFLRNPISAAFTFSLSCFGKNSRITSISGLELLLLQRLLLPFWICFYTAVFKRLKIFQSFYFSLFYVLSSISPSFSSLFSLSPLYNFCFLFLFLSLSSPFYFSLSSLFYFSLPFPSLVSLLFLSLFSLLYFSQFSLLFLPPSPFSLLFPPLSRLYVLFLSLSIVVYCCSQVAEMCSSILTLPSFCLCSSSYSCSKAYLLSQNITTWPHLTQMLTRTCTSLIIDFPVFLFFTIKSSHEFFMFYDYRLGLNQIFTLHV